MIIHTTVGNVRCGDTDVMECVYHVANSDGRSLYVGQTKNLRNRFQNHLSPSKSEKLAKALHAALPNSLAWPVELWMADEFNGDLNAVEAILIKARKPTLNADKEVHALIVYRQEDVETAVMAARPKRTINTIVNMVCDAVTSDHTRRAYSRALTDFMVWFQRSGQDKLNKASVNAHITALRASGVGASSINQRLAAIRKLANEAADNGLIDYATAQAIAKAEGVRTEGKRLGNWLSRQDAQRLLDAPDDTIKGIRDRAILAVLLGCGLRREECARLTIEHIQQREGRWVVVDLVGKRNKIRSVPMPSWAKSAVDAWCKVADIVSGAVFLSIRRGGNVQREGMTAQAIRNVVAEYSEVIGLTVAPHDLRRSFAKLAHKGGAPIDQIQLSLGHNSIQTTERYLGVDQNLNSAPCDVLGLR